MQKVILVLLFFSSVTTHAMTLECQSQSLTGKRANDFLIHVQAHSSGLIFEAEIVESDPSGDIVSNATDVYFINDRLIMTAAADKADWSLASNQSECFVTTDIPHINLKESFFSADYSGTVTFYQDIQANPKKRGCSLSSIQSNRKSQFLSCMIYDDE